MGIGAAACLNETSTHGNLLKREQQQQKQHQEDQHHHHHQLAQHQATLRDSNDPINKRVFFNVLANVLSLLTFAALFLWHHSPKPVPASPPTSPSCRATGGAELVAVDGNFSSRSSFDKIINDDGLLLSVSPFQASLQQVKPRRSLSSPDLLLACPLSPPSAARSLPLRDRTSTVCISSLLS